MRAEGVQLKKHRSAGFRIPHAGFVVKNKFPLDFFFFLYKGVFSLQCSSLQGAGRRARAQGAGESSLP